MKRNRRINAIPAAVNPGQTQSDVRPSDPYNVSSNLNSMNSIAALQEYLRIISFYDPAIPRVNVDGILGEETRNAILQFQEVYNIPRFAENTDYLTWIAARDVARRYQRGSAPGESIVPLPRRDALNDWAGDTHFVSLLQVMLNTIRQKYPELRPLEIDGVWSNDLQSNLVAIAILYGYPSSDGLDSDAWFALTDAYNGTVQEVQLRRDRANGNARPRPASPPMDVSQSPSVQVPTAPQAAPSTQPQSSTQPPFSQQPPASAQPPSPMQNTPSTQDPSFSQASPFSQPPASPQPPSSAQTSQSAKPPSPVQNTPSTQDPSFSQASPFSQSPSSPQTP